MNSNLKTNYNEFIDSINQLSEGMVISMLYEGRIDQEIISSISEMSGKRINSNNESERIRKIVIFIIIEMLQNICKYSSDSYEKEGRYIGKGIVVVGKVENSYYIVTRNKIHNKDMSQLKEIEKWMNNASQDELNKAYFAKLTSAKVHDKSGAGLGLIEIARKSGNTIKFNFSSSEESQSYFTIITMVSRNPTK